MRVFSICVYFLFVFHLFGQRTLSNKISSMHQNIKGTKISLIPPKGFSDATNFQGYQHIETGSSIMVLNIPGPFSEVSKGLNKSSLEKKGVQLIEKEELVFGLQNACLISARQTMNGIDYFKFILTFGNDSETIMINGVYPEGRKKVGEEILKSMLSVVYHENKKIDPFASVDFTLDVSKTKLKFSQNISNSLLYTSNGEKVTNTEELVSLIVTKSFSEIPVQDKKLFCIKRIQQMPVEILEIEKTNEIIIDNLSGFEIYAKTKNKKTDKIEFVYQVILFTNDMYYLFYGLTNENAPSNLEEIKNAVLTFKRK